FPGGDGTSGVAVQAGGDLQLTRSAVVRASSVGIQLFGGTLTLDDSIVADTERHGVDSVGHGIQVSSGSTCTASRSALVRNAGSALLMARSIDDADAGTASFDGCVIADGVGYDDGSFGRGVDISGAASLDLATTAIVGNRELGVLIAGEGTVARLAGS